MKIIAKLAVVLAIPSIVWVYLYWKIPLLATDDNFIAWLQTGALVATGGVVGIYT